MIAAFQGIGYLLTTQSQCPVVAAAIAIFPQSLSLIYNRKHPLMLCKLYIFRGLKMHIDNQGRS